MSLEIERNGLLSTLKDLSLSTGAKISVFDLSCEEMLTYPYTQSAVCRRIRASDKGDEMCRHCDRNALAQASTQNGSLVYRCHAGLQEAVCPIQRGESTVGYIMMGQCMPADTPVQSLLHQTHLPGFTDAKPTILETEIATLPRVTEVQFGAYAGILQACAGYISHAEYVRPQKMDDFERIRQYVEANFAAPLSAELLCSALYLSRNSLFKIVKQETGLSLGQYIQKRRLRFAKKLLQTTDYSILHIADLCGINDFNYFGRVFKIEYGKSPREYRKMFTQ